MDIRVGFPEFHEQVVDRHQMFFETIPALQQVLNSLTGEAYTSISAERYLILNLGILAGVSMMEIVLMAINGFGPGAVKAARSLLEASVTAEFIRLHPEHYEDFYEWQHIERFKETEFLKTYLPDTYDSLDPEWLQSLHNETTRVGDRFGKRSTWCKHDLAERAKLTGYLESYRLLNPIASGFIHVTPYGLHRRFGKEDTSRIDVPQSMSWVGESLVSGHVLGLGMVHTLVQCFHPELEHTVFGQLENDCRRAWPPD